MSIIKKIMFKGYSKPDGFPRERIERELEPPRYRKISLKRHTKMCKRNGNKPHTFILIKETYYEWSKCVYQDYKCTHCGKQSFKRK